MHIWSGKNNAPKLLKNLIWEGLGLNLGGVWVALGRLLSTFGCTWVGFWAFKIVSFSSIGPRWAPRGLWHRFWIDFGRVLKRFWEVLRGSWDYFGSILERFWYKLGKASES